MTAETVLAALVATLAVVVLAIVGAAVLLVRTISAAWVRQDKHLTDVLDRFLSRTFEEHTMANMIRGEVNVDQDDDRSIDIADDDAAHAEDFVAQMEAKMKSVGEEAVAEVAE